MPAPTIARSLGRALQWGAAWGIGAGAVEAAWHLSRWSLPVTGGAGSGFFARALLYSGGYLALVCAALAVAIRFVPWTRRARAADGAADRIGVAGVIGGLVLLHGVVWWRVGHHINAPWSSPVLLGGLLVAALLAGLAALAGWLAARPAWLHTPWARLVPLPLAVALYLVAPTGAAAPAPREDPTRVLLVTLDTFRADRVGAAGGPVATPALDGLAARGVLFTQAVAQAPITCPAHLSILSGASPASHGVFANGTRIPAELPLLQESFRAAGVPTAAFVAGYPVTTRFGFDRGFDTFDDDFGDHLGDHRLTARKLLDQALYARGAPRERRADQVRARAEPWLRDHAASGFFAWVHLFDPHGPYAPPAPFVESLAGPMPAPVEGPEMPHYWPAAMRRIADADYWARRYDEEIAYTDDQLGRLFAALADAGVLDDTLIAVIGDHGESLDEHGYYFDHGLHLYDASLRIPFLLAGPGVDAGRTVPCQVRGMDLAPTVLDLAGLDTPPSMEGETLVPLWTRGCPASGLRLSVAATVEPPWLDDPGAELALRSDGDARFKYVRHRRSDDELYDLTADPGETEDLRGRHDDIEAWMSENLDRVSAGMDAVAPQLSAEVEAQLRALGYIVDAPRDAGVADDDDSAGGPAAPGAEGEGPR